VSYTRFEFEIITPRNFDLHYTPWIRCGSQNCIQRIIVLIILIAMQDSSRHFDINDIYLSVYVLFLSFFNFTCQFYRSAIMAKWLVIVCFVIALHIHNFVMNEQTIYLWCRVICECDYTEEATVLHMNESGIIGKYHHTIWFAIIRTHNQDMNYTLRGYGTCFRDENNSNIVYLWSNVLPREYS
jgi:hypothetical protein